MSADLINLSSCWHILRRYQRRLEIANIVIISAASGIGQGVVIVIRIGATFTNSLMPENSSKCTIERGFITVLFLLITGAFLRCHFSLSKTNSREVTSAFCMLEQYWVFQFSTPHLQSSFDCRWYGHRQHTSLWIHKKKQMPPLKPITWTLLKFKWYWQNRAGHFGYLYYQ